MKQGTHKGLILLFVILCAVAAMVLRQVQIQTVFDADGLPVSGSPITWALAIVCILVPVVLLLLLRSTPPRQQFYCSIFLTPLGMILTLLAAFAVGIGSLIHFGEVMEIDSSISSVQLSVSGMVIPFGGIITALCALMTVNRMANMRRPLLALYLLPFLFVIVELVLEFKNNWSSDPIILDYCFCLFALICVMYALYYVMGFCFDRGRRRHALFWCLTAFFFCAVSVMGNSVDQIGIYAGLGLWMLSLAIPLLTDQVPDYVKNPDEPEPPSEPVEPTE